MLCAASVVMLLLSVFLQRGVYTGLGAIGVASYLGYSAFGVTVMYPGYMYYRHRQIYRYGSNMDHPHRSAG